MQARHAGWFRAAATTLALTFVAWPVLAEEKQSSGDKVAVVNGTVITQKNFSNEVMVVRQKIESKGKRLNDSQISKLKTDILEGLIDRELLYQESQKKGFKVEDEAVNEQFETLKKRFSNETEFRSSLVKMNLTEAGIRDQIKKGMSIQQFIDKQFAQEKTVSAEEIKAYYDSHPDFFKKPEQVWASHILIKVDPLADESVKAEARKEIEKVQQRLRNGEDFAALAKEFSKCPSSANGGDLGSFKRGQMVKPFEEASFALKPGEVSEIVETKFGYHLIKVTGKESEKNLTFEEIKEDSRLVELIKKQKIREKITLYVKELREKGKVERFR